MSQPYDITPVVEQPADDVGALDPPCVVFESGDD